MFTVTAPSPRTPGRWLGLAAMTLASLVLALDITVLVTALPTLSEKLSATTSQLQWMSAAYTLALAGLLLPAGVLGDRLGRRRILLLGLVLFGLSSLAASQVTRADALIVMRAVQGIGGAIIFPMSLSVLPTMFQEDERTRAIAIAGAGAFIALPLGPLVAGWLLDHYEWGSIFLINVPVVVLALIGVWYFVPESRNPAAGGIDWLGAFLEVTGVTALVYGIIEQPVAGWTDAKVLTGLIAGTALIAAFITWQLRTRHPLIDLRLFLEPGFAGATAAFTVVGFGMTGLLFMLAPYIQVVEGNDAQSTGIRLLPMIAAVILGALATDPLSRRVSLRVMIPAGLLITAAGFLLLALLTPDGSYALVATGLMVSGLGIAVAMIPSLNSILSLLPETQTGTGTALTRTLQNIGGSFGVAIMGSVLNGVYRSQLVSHTAALPPPVRDAAERGVAVAAAVSRHLPPAAGSELLSSARQAYVAGMAAVMVVTAALIVMFALVIAIFMSTQARAVQVAVEA